jgi:hypothetical protein
MNRTRTPQLARFLRTMVGFAALVAPVAAGFCAEMEQQESGWHLTRSADPRGGPEAIAMMHTADTTKSDLGLAGLMIRCGEHDLEVVVVTTMPFEPRVHPLLRLRAGTSDKSMDATVVAPFSALLLPKEATLLADGTWQSASELLIEIEGQPAAIKGVVPIAGLKSAMAMLRANCPIR